MNKNIFNTVQMTRPNQNTFDLSHDVKLSFKMGSLVPICAMDLLPGDVFNISFESMLRFSALIAPVMHRIRVTQHYFFVPNRILWSNWESFITQESDIEPPYTKPHLSIGEPTWISEKGSIGDYMGLPTFFVTDAAAEYVPEFNALPFAAYWKIMAEYYFDQNLQAQEMEIANGFSKLQDGDNSLLEGIPGVGFLFANYNFLAVTLPNRAWAHDYFTSALPFAQKGEQVEMPIGDFNDVEVFTDPSFVPGPATPGGKFQTAAGSIFVPAANSILFSDAAAGGSLTDNNDNIPLYYDGNGSLRAETSALTAGTASINNLRRAFRLQEWLEKNARGGTRYFESMLVHFGVKSPDARLQRPEYIGGAVQNMVISEVLSTAQTINAEAEVVNPVGQMSGHAISVGGSKVLNYRAQEHGWIIGIINVQPDTAYFQGIPKKFNRPDIFDYMFPTFAHIGEQEVLNQEVYLDMLAPGPVDPESPTWSNLGTFGYVPRYSEYRFENNRVAGEFRDTLDFWHLARKFDSQPSLNGDFVKSNPSTRIFAVEEGDHIYAHVLLKIKARRPLPRFGTPSF